MKTLTRTFTVSGGTYTYKKPNACPHCGNLVEAEASAISCGNKVFVVFFTCPSGECKKLFWAVYKDVGGDSKFAEMKYMYPEFLPPEIGENIKSLSPNFVDMYRQAFRSENNGDKKFAACGYRNALEILIKDYAIEYRGETASEVLHKMPLAACIEKYLDGFDETVSAYLIKEFGNDTTHYPPLTEKPLDFEKLKSCLDVFIRQTEAKLVLLEASRELPQKLQDKFDLPPPTGDPPPYSIQ